MGHATPCLKVDNLEAPMGLYQTLPRSRENLGATIGCAIYSREVEKLGGMHPGLTFTA